MRGKREMKRNYTPFVAGMATMALLIGLIASSFAANGAPAKPADGGESGGAAPAGVSVGLFLRRQIAPGETLTTEKGGTAPKVLSYADSKGETHYYIEAAAVAEIFDVTNGVTFHEEANQLEFGYKPFGQEKKWDVFYSPERYDFTMGGTINPDGSRLIVGGDIPMDMGDGMVATVRNGNSNPDPEYQKEVWARHKSILKEKPEYGKTCGMYTEVDPAEMNLGSLSAVDMKGKEFQDGEEIRHTFCFSSIFGKYAAVTIENTGAAEAEIDLRRLNAVGSGQESFTGIYLPAGAKITRAFRIDETKPLENQLELCAKPLGEGGVSLKLTNEQYRSGV